MRKKSIKREEKDAVETQSLRTHETKEERGEKKTQKRKKGKKQVK